MKYSPTFLTLKNNTMKQIFILVFKHEATDTQKINSFFDRKEMQTHEAQRLNENLQNTIWILTPNY